MSTTSTAPAPRPAAVSGRRRTWRDLPVVHQLRQSVGVQRAMLVIGLVVTAVFVLVAVFARVLAPYSWAQLQSGGRVELRGFGAFSTRGRDARKGRNPRTGEPVDVSAKSVPYFKPGKEMRERLNV